MLSDQILEVLLFQNGNAGRMKGTSQFGRIAAVGDIRYLGSSKSHDAVGGIVAKHHVEVMEVPAGGTEDNYLFHIVIAQRPRLFRRCIWGAESRTDHLYQLKLKS